MRDEVTCFDTLRPFDEASKRIMLLGRETLEKGESDIEIKQLFTNICKTIELIKVYPVTHCLKNVLKCFIEPLTQ